MKCGKKFFWLSAVLLFWLSAFSWAEVILTDDEAAELTDHLTMLENILNVQNVKLNEQATLLTRAQEQLTVAQSELQKAKISIENLQQEILLLNDSLDEAERFWQRRQLAAIVIAGSSGLVLGGLLGAIITVISF